MGQPVGQVRNAYDDDDDCGQNNGGDDKNNGDEDNDDDDDNVSINSNTLNNENTISEQAATKPVPEIQDANYDKSITPPQHQQNTHKHNNTIILNALNEH